MIREACSITMPANISNSILFACGRSSQCESICTRHTQTGKRRFISIGSFRFLPHSFAIPVCLSFCLPHEGVWECVCNRVGKEEAMLTQSSSAVMPARHSVIYWGGWRRIIYKKEKKKSLASVQLSKYKHELKMSNLFLTITWTDLWALAYWIFP